MIAVAAPGFLRHLPSNSDLGVKEGFPALRKAVIEHITRMTSAIPASERSWVRIPFRTEVFCFACDRYMLKAMFNPRFGSVFRTYNNSTYFTRRLVRFADLYMSSVENLLNYPSNYTFYPRRTALPHEAVLDFRSSGIPDQRIFPNT